MSNSCRYFQHVYTPCLIKNIIWVPITFSPYMMHPQDVHSVNGFSKVGQRFWVHSKGWIPGRIMMHWGWDHKYSEHLRWDENPCATRSHHQRWQISVNLCAAILGDCLVGPHILPPHVSGSDNLDFLRTYLRGLLENVSFNTRVHMWVQHNGAPPLTAVKCVTSYPRIFLDAGFVADLKLQVPILNALYFILWGRLETKACACRVDSG
jgi:hypothetical protein